MTHFEPRLAHLSPNFTHYCFESDIGSSLLMVMDVTYLKSTSFPGLFIFVPSCNFAARVSTFLVPLDMSLSNFSGTMAHSATILSFSSIIVQVQGNSYGWATPLATLNSSNVLCPQVFICPPNGLSFPPGDVQDWTQGSCASLGGGGGIHLSPRRSETEHLATSDN